MERPQNIKDQFPGEEFWTEQQYIARVRELEAEVERLRDAIQDFLDDAAMGKPGAHTRLAAALDARKDG